LAYQRLVLPRIGVKYEKKYLYINCSWRTLFEKLKNLFFYTKFDFVQMLCGSLTDYNTIMALKDFAQTVGTSNLCLNKKNIDFKEDYLYSSSSSINTDGDIAIYIFLGFNPKVELSLLNAKLKVLYKEFYFEAFNFGEELSDLGYPVKHVGNLDKSFYNFLQGRHVLCKKLYENKDKKVIIIVGLFLQQLIYYENIKKYLNKLKKKFENLIVNYIQLTTACVSSYELGLAQGICSSGLYENFKDNKHNKALFYDISLLFEESFLKNKENIIIYQGSHIDNVINYAKYIIPSNLFVEKNALYINLEGNIQQGKLVVGSPILARTDFEIFKALHVYFLNYLIKKNIIKAELCRNVFTFIFKSGSNLTYVYDVMTFRPKIYKRIKEQIPFLKFRSFFWLLISLSLILLLDNNKKESNLFINKNVYNIYKKDALTLHSRILNLCSFEYLKRSFYKKKIKKVFFK